MLQEMGMKKVAVDKDSRKILISHTRQDQQLNNIIYGLLLFNGFKENEIIYTSDPDNKSSIPFGQDVYDYLREFFVKSYSNKPIYVLYVYSDRSAHKPGVLQEIGAGWVVQSDHGIIQAGTAKPGAPLNTTTLYPNICLDSLKNRIVTTENHFGVMYQLLEHVCRQFGKKIKSIEENKIKYQGLGGEFLSENDFGNFIHNIK